MLLGFHDERVSRLCLRLKWTGGGRCHGVVPPRRSSYAVSKLRVSCRSLRHTRTSLRMMLTQDRTPRDKRLAREAQAAGGTGQGVVWCD